MSLVRMQQQRSRLRAEPIAEVCGFVASNKPVQIVPAASRLPQSLSKAPAYTSLRRSTLLCSRDTPKATAAAAAKTQHERALSLLRTVLATAKLPEPAASEKQAWGLDVLEEQRLALVRMLRDTQSAQAEKVVAAHALMSSRAACGLVDATSARAYGRALRQSSAYGIAMPAAAHAVSSNDSLASSLSSTSSEATLNDGDSDGGGDDAMDGPSRPGLIESWAANSFWRGMSARPWSASRPGSVCSDRTLPVADATGMCWSLDAGDDAASAWGQFYASLGGVRIPTRFRQLMMRNDKLRCPLKNRLVEPNPRRLAFEDHIRATGSVPTLDLSASTKPPSTLRRQLWR
ncbi:hypothetical protein BX661DRAFT_197534 [Kickxella alabastrina]|uniref:uncharacterized protein n=1 Tax=Kickxella alabastrina TaxID=61397 RepID=UPI002220F794|nr:uncharacterized protein BX661DRAFT_197534 [Kickxella alabastrina]KAI7830994.1 hypothetical protein BX661DRAFT_197534 [Kickxella alabastrina]